MAQVGHFYAASGLSAFRVFAPSALGVVVLLADSGERLALARDGIGHWFG